MTIESQESNLPGQIAAFTAFAVVVGWSLAIFAWAEADDEKKIAVPEIPGLDIKAGRTVVIQPGSRYPVVFQFVDNRILVRVGELQSHGWRVVVRR
jgi:hypothetical protein